MPQQGKQTVYDLVRYPATPMARVDPARLAALAILLGRPAVPFQACRMLEIGCGEGINLINLALMAPHSAFTGFDYAATAIDMARETAALAGVRNVTFRHLDLLEAGTDLGSFDYVIAHGVYAWVPEAVREALMRLAGQCLSEHGLFFVSYNVAPGCHLRQMLRDILLAETAAIADPAQKLQTVRERLELYSELWDRRDGLPKALAEEARRLMERPPAVVFHDELGEVYAPQTFGATIAHAGRHGLAYLCDADPAHMAAAVAPDEQAALLLQDAGGDWLRFQERTDYVQLTRFRESVFCRAREPVGHAPAVENLTPLYAFAAFSALPPGADGEFAFAVDKGGSFTTHDPVFAAALTRLAQAAPGFVALAGFPDASVRTGLLRLALAHVIVLRTEPYVCTYAPGERPRASPLARVQAARGEARLPSLRQINVDIGDATALELIQLMDGTRTLPDIALALHGLADMPLEELQRRLPDAVLAMARLGLMLG